jgi:NAD+ diphosphatase
MDHYRRSARNCFAGNAIDRMTTRRQDEIWLAEQLKNPNTIFIPVWDSKQLFTNDQVPNPVFISREQMGEFFPAAESFIFLGKKDATTVFAVDLPPDGPPFFDRLSEFGQFQDLKRFGALLDDHQAALMAYARAITHWHRRHRFCGDCGSTTVSMDGGHRRLCTNPQCEQQHFPRTDPAVITLVRSGKRCLLGRQPVWPKGFFSAIAGFVEPGESLEAAVVREIHEETGVRATEVQYHSSQPWPFPSSIMLGFTALALDKNIRLRDHELEDARWFSRKEIEEGLEADRLRLPSNLSIAYRLIEDWFDASGSTPLRTFLDSIPGYQHVILLRS